MQITHATSHVWRKEVVDDSLSLFGKSEQKKLNECLKKVSDNGISYIIQPLDDDFLSWWLPMYQDRINTKDNPVVFDVNGKTLNNPDTTKKYYSLTLVEGEERLGGVIFSIKEDTLFFAYRTLQYDWKKAKLRASPSLYVEYVIAEYAKERELKKVSHGKDRNPYGLNSSIGLALFKLSTGCLPLLVGAEIEIKTLDTDELTKDVLVFEYPTVTKEPAEISKVYLIADEEGKKKWEQINRYSDRLNIEVITRKAT